MTLYRKLPPKDSKGFRQSDRLFFRLQERLDFVDIWTSARFRDEAVGGDQARDDERYEAMSQPSIDSG